jgi:hypothetical protein
VVLSLKKDINHKEKLMAKIDIILNNKTFSVDEEVINEAIEKLRSYLTTQLNGTGGKIDISGITYIVDGAKLAAAKNGLTTYLGTIAGNGEKITVNGVEYSVDASKLNNVLASLEADFGELGGSTTPAEERLEGDG